MIYLSSPYTDPSLAVREHRFRIACRAAAHLMRLGFVVFSPIAHGHHLVPYGLPTDWGFWERQDRGLLERCEQMVVLMLDGWRESVGVQAEIQIATELGIPIRYWELDDERGVTLARVRKEAEP